MVAADTGDAPAARLPQDTADLGPWPPDRSGRAPQLDRDLELAASVAGGAVVDAEVERQRLGMQEAGPREVAARRRSSRRATRAVRTCAPPDRARHAAASRGRRRAAAQPVGPARARERVRRESHPSPRSRTRRCPGARCPCRRPGPPRALSPGPRPGSSRSAWAGSDGAAARAAVATRVENRSISSSSGDRSRRRRQHLHGPSHVVQSVDDVARDGRRRPLGEARGGRERPGSDRWSTGCRRRVDAFRTATPAPPRRGSSGRARSRRDRSTFVRSSAPSPACLVVRLDREIGAELVVRGVEQVH